MDFLGRRFYAMLIGVPRRLIGRPKSVKKNFKDPSRLWQTVAQEAGGGHKSEEGEHEDEYEAAQEERDHAWPHRCRDARGADVVP